MATRAELRKRRLARCIVSRPIELLDFKELPTFDELVEALGNTSNQSIESRGVSRNLRLWAVRLETLCQRMEDAEAWWFPRLASGEARGSEGGGREDGR